MTDISRDVCELVTICDPNIIVQDCLPAGSSPHCDYTIQFAVCFDVKDTASIVELPDDNCIVFDFNKMTDHDSLTGPEEYWQATAVGGDGDDHISGAGLLWGMEFFSFGMSARVDPSVYLGDLVFFNIDGGKGDDCITGANNADILVGGEGCDWVYGLKGDDSITGDAGADHLYGGDGQDLVGGGDGNDCISGGDGNDGLTGDAGDDEVWGDCGDDNVDGGAGNDHLYGGDGNDWVSGGDGDDCLAGDDGDDCMSGGAGDDDMYGGCGDDRMLGDDGDDHMYGGDGNDKLSGEMGDDCVSGGDGDDLVTGGGGDDEVYGGCGDDIVRGGPGEDMLWGGEGCDVFAFCAVELNCADKIMDFQTGFDADQIDVSQVHGLDAVRAVLTGHDDEMRFDLFVDGVAVERIFVTGCADLQEVFSTDSAYGTDNVALMKIASGVIVDLPSTSVLFADGDGLFV